MIARARGSQRTAVRCAMLACALALAAPARAQLPPLAPLPATPLQLPSTPLKLPADPAAATGIVPPLRARANLDKLRRYGDRIETDPNGNLIVRDEIVAYLPSSATLAKVRAQGYTVIRQRQLTGLDAIIAVLKPGDGASAVDGLRRLREQFPDGVFDLNHLYSDSGEVDARGKPRRPVETPAAAAKPARKIGLIDGGVDGGTDALREIRIHRDGCGGREIASAHGTAVASLMVGRMGKFHGAAPGAELYAADIYCGEPTGGSVDAIVAAFGWMAGQRIPVVNVSVVGPANRVLELTVRGMLQRGHHIVAAVGNDGPAAPPLYPAAYSGVIGVTAVDAGWRVLPEASRGPQVLFAAPGADMAAAKTPNGYTDVRGTSFAAPIVAGLLALLFDEPNPAAAQRALAQLIGAASDLGPPGKDPIFGYGLVGWKVRVDPSQVGLAEVRR